MTMTTTDELGQVETTMTASSENGSTSTTPTEDKGHTFRKRRLSLTNLRQLTGVSNQEVGAGEEPKDHDIPQTETMLPPPLPSQPTTLPMLDLRYEEQNPELSVAAASLAKQQSLEDPSAASGSIAGVVASASATTSDSENEKAHTFRKRRLSLTTKSETDSVTDTLGGLEPGGDAMATGTGGEAHVKRRRNSDVSIGSLESQHTLKTRVMHSSELLANPPLSPSNLPRLYQQSAPPQQHSSLLDTPGGESGLTPVPRWKKRHTRQLHEDERILPFPRDIVGTFSCHGVEPIYDSDYQPDPEDEEEDDSDLEGVAGGGLTMSNSYSPSQQQDRPTTAAKINQDRGGVAFPYGNCARTALFAAYDGHGQGGELVSQFALHEVQRRLEKHPDFTANIEKAFKETFLAVDEALKHEALIEPLYAGTTACVALLRENELIVSNVGDSRAVLARCRNVTNGGGNGEEGENVQWETIDLSKDQNPDLPEEQRRIESMGGYVSPPPEPGLSARVWLDPGCTQIGLAMSRSMGDHAVKPVGVIAEPVVSTHHVTEDDDFLILASDGVWEFVASHEAVRVVSDNLHLGATRACQALIEMAAARWHDEEGDYRDDITALVIRLQHLWKKDDGNKKKEEVTGKEATAISATTTSTEKLDVTKES